MGNETPPSLVSWISQAITKEELLHYRRVGGDKASESECFVCLPVCFFLYDFAEFAASELQTVTMFLCGTSAPGAVVDNCHPSYSRPRFLAGDGLQV